MTTTFPSCNNLQPHVDRFRPDKNAAQPSLKKVISPQFEVVFAGTFSAGKSMLMNALLEQELLYSPEGYATETECYIASAEPAQEEMVLTFLSEAEIREQVTALCQQLGIKSNINININQIEAIKILEKGCQKIIQQEGGESQSERAKQAKALFLYVLTRKLKVLILQPLSVC